MGSKLEGLSRLERKDFSVLLVHVALVQPFNLVTNDLPQCRLHVSNHQRCPGLGNANADFHPDAFRVGRQDLSKHPVNKIIMLPSMSLNRRSISRTAYFFKVISPVKDPITSVRSRQGFNADLIAPSEVNFDKWLD